MFLYDHVFNILCDVGYSKKLRMWTWIFTGAVSSTSTAAKVGAIVLAIILSLVLLGGIVALCMMAAKRRGAKKSAPEIFEGAPPGGTH